jgi:hypothetical protein
VLSPLTRTQTRGSSHSGTFIGCFSLRHALSSQVVHKRLGDVPVVPELCFAPRLAGPRIPGRAVGPPTADSDLPVRCPFFGRHMRGRAAEVSVTEFLHEFHFSREVPARRGGLCSIPAGPVIAYVFDIPVWRPRQTPRTLHGEAKAISGIRASHGVVAGRVRDHQHRR